VPGERGWKFGAVVGDGPAAQAGLLVGDVITRLNDAEIDDYDAIAQFLIRQRPGTSVTVTVRRGDAEFAAQVPLTPPPTAALTTPR
jgi:putative serine protease PepD